MNKQHKILFGLLLLSLVLLCGCGGDGGKTPSEPLPETESADGASAQEEPPSEEEAEPIYITLEGTDLPGGPFPARDFPLPGVHPVREVRGRLSEKMLAFHRPSRV